MRRFLNTLRALPVPSAWALPPNPAAGEALAITKRRAIEAGVMRDATAARFDDREFQCRFASAYPIAGLPGLTESAQLWACLFFPHDGAPNWIPGPAQSADRHRIDASQMLPLCGQRTPGPTDPLDTYLAAIRTSLVGRGRREWLARFAEEAHTFALVRSNIEADTRSFGGTNVSRSLQRLLLGSGLLPAQTLIELADDGEIDRATHARPELTALRSAAAMLLAIIDALFESRAAPARSEGSGLVQTVARAEALTPDDARDWCVQLVRRKLQQFSVLAKALLRGDPSPALRVYVETLQSWVATRILARDEDDCGC